MIDAFPTDRRGLEVLSLAECERLLSLEQVGRVAVISRGEPLVMPVSYRYHHRTVVFRTAAGEKLDAATLRSPAAFEIDGWYPATRTGWSVLAKGTFEEVYQDGEIADLDALGIQPWVPAVQPTSWVRIRPQEITGRRIV